MVCNTHQKRRKKVYHCMCLSQNIDKTYIIYSDNAFAPFEYLDEKTNTYVGLDINHLAAIAED